MNFFANRGEEATSLELWEHRLPGLSETELEEWGCAMLGTTAKEKLCCLLLLKKCSLPSSYDTSLGALS